MPAVKGARGHSFDDLTGRSFSRWSVVDQGPKLPCGTIQWNCICDCGTRKLVRAGKLRGGISKSCGCLAIEKRTLKVSNGYEKIQIESFLKIIKYDPETGNLVWMECKGNAAKGSIAGTINNKGYVEIGLDSHSYLAHRLIWWLYYGVWPTGPIDHVNGLKSDNRIENLRQADAQINSQNRRLASRNCVSGLLGAHKSGNRWRGSIVVDGKRVNLGSYADPKDAHEAYIKAKRDLHKGCTL